MLATEAGISTPEDRLEIESTRLSTEATDFMVLDFDRTDAGISAPDDRLEMDSDRSIFGSDLTEDVARVVVVVRSFSTSFIASWRSSASNPSQSVKIDEKKNQVIVS